MLTILTTLAQQGGQPDPAATAVGAGVGIVMMLFMCMIFVLSLAAFVFWVWMIIDCVRREFPGNEKVVWILVIVLLSFLGALIYFFLGRPKGRLPGSGGSVPPAPPMA